MVHLYKNNGYNIVIDANSGCVHSVDEVAYDMIGLFEKLDKQTLIKTVLEKYAGNPAIDEAELEEIYGDIIALKESKQLFSDDEFADFQWDFKKRNSVLKAICLHVAHDCNLACKYCFAGKGEYNGEKALMSYETGKQALDFLVANSGTRHNLEVDFFGGEPLMNFEVVKQLTAYGRSLEEKYNKNFRFTLTTNGILVDDEVINFCNREMSNVVLSIDGRKCVNDRMRVSRNGNGSYDHILPKFLQFVEQRGNKDYYLRGTYTGFNKDFSADIIHLADLGFKELSMEPVVCDPSEEYSLHESDIPALCEQYQILADEMLRRKREKNGFTFYHYMIDLMGGPCIAKRISGCGVGVEYMAVTPTGELYPCHQFVSDDRFLLGNVWDGVLHPEVLNEFKHCNVYAHEECKDCFARLYCSGGCAANAFHSTGSIRGVYKLGCELHKKRIECAIMLKVAEQTEGLEE
ncbi:MAG: thioether cross-link-forming SCIFF peptide maturase [Clostridia bacterium]|nr:thioether cross-link-forming SCIFF peptide maturase [Clostridia bacterium]